MTYKPLIPVPAAVLILLTGLLAAGYLIGKRRDVWWKKAFSFFRILVILGLIFLITLRPMTEEYDQEVELRNTNVIFAVDTTISMWAEDGSTGKNATRMDDTVSACEYIMKQLSGSSFALLRFDNRSQILAPFTEDQGSIEDALETIHQPSSDYAKGSSLNVPMEDLKSLLESSRKKKDRKTILFFFSDGEITDGSKLAPYRELEPSLDGGAVVAVGTSQGAKMKSSEGRTITDPETGKNAVSKMDETTLKQMAENLDLDEIHLTSDEDLSYLTDIIRSSSSSEIGKSDAVSYRDTYFYYVPFLAGFLLLELIIVVRKKKI